jgi:hypothetical protein
MALTADQPKKAEPTQCWPTKTVAYLERLTISEAILRSTDVAVMFSIHI